MALAMLGKDGTGYELAKKLESAEALRAWLGDSLYTHTAPHLTCFSAWKNFMASTNTNDLHLQMRVRALLYDKALHPSYLQLHADDVYYSLEEDVDDWQRLQAEGSLTAKSLQMKDIEGTSCAGSRLTTSEVENLSSRSKNGEVLDTWYSLWRKKHLIDRMNRHSWRLAQQELPFGERDTFKRTPEGMSAYLMLSQKHRKKHRFTKLDRELPFTNSTRENVSGVQAECTVESDCSMDEDMCLFPETTFPFNCVPDNSVPGQDKEDENASLELPGISDNLPYETNRSPLLIERFGFSKVDSTGKNRAADKRKRLGEEEAAHRVRKTVVLIAREAGFEGLKEVSMDVLSQFLSCHMCKLARTLRLLADSLRNPNQDSQIDLLRMFLQTIGYSNLETLTDYLKTGTKLSPQQTQQQPVPVTQAQHQTMSPHTPQFQRQQQSMNLTNQQQQWERARRKQPLTPRSSGRKLEKDRIAGDVKIEISNDSALATPLVSQHHAQWQQQQQSIQGSHHPQSLPQFKQHSSLQISHIQQQSLFARDVVQMRTQPVKVEGFQELMGGDVSVKETEDEIGRTLMSPRKL